MITSTVLRVKALNYSYIIVVVKNTFISDLELIYHSPTPKVINIIR